MKKVFSLGFVVITLLVFGQTWNTEDEYIQDFAPLAVQEMELFHIPASITLAQGLLETAGGQSRLAQEGKNHFGIKCKEEWTGKTLRHTDDAPNECFRAYDSVEESYRDHSLFLAKRKYYKNLFTLDPKDYKAWAHGLKKAGYATNPQYAPALINKIEKYKLYQFDQTTSADVYALLLNLYPDLNNNKDFMAKLGKEVKEPAPTIHVPYTQGSYAERQEKVEKIREEAQKMTTSEILQKLMVKNHPNGGIKYIVIPQDIDLSYISKKYKISERRLKRINELENTHLKTNDIVFLDTKKSRGNAEYYTAKSGDTMYEIAQKFAIKLKRLYALNRMSEGQQPSASQVIYLKSKKPRS